MDLLEIDAIVRKETGNGPARALRRQGRVPAVFYGPAAETTPLSIDASQLEQTLKGSSSTQVLLSLNIKNGKTVTKPVMIKELQIHPVSREFIHVDFYEVDMNRKIHVKVPITTTGKSAGVEMGGTLQVVRREVEVFCYPNRIPEAIEVDITQLQIGESIHVEELPLEEGIEIPSDVNFTVITVLSQKMEEEEADEEELEGEEAEAATEPEASESETES